MEAIAHLPINALDNIEYSAKTGWMVSLKTQQDGSPIRTDSGHKHSLIKSYWNILYLIEQNKCFKPNIKNSKLNSITAILQVFRPQNSEHLLSRALYGGYGRFFRGSVEAMVNI